MASPNFDEPSFLLKKLKRIDENLTVLADVGAHDLEKCGPVSIVDIADNEALIKNQKHSNTDLETRFCGRLF